MTARCAMQYFATFDSETSCPVVALPLVADRARLVAVDAFEAAADTPGRPEVKPATVFVVEAKPLVRPSTVAHAQVTCPQLERHRDTVAVGLPGGRGVASAPTGCAPPSPMRPVQFVDVAGDVASEIDDARFDLSEAFRVSAEPRAQRR